MTTPLAWTICSSTIWPIVAWPELAQRTRPGAPRARASSSARVSGLKPAWASSSTGVCITLTSGAKSRCAS